MKKYKHPTKTELITLVAEMPKEDARTLHNILIGSYLSDIKPRTHYYRYQAERHTGSLKALLIFLGNIHIIESSTLTNFYINELKKDIEKENGPLLIERAKK
jgi:hypothetical protein